MSIRDSDDEDVKNEAEDEEIDDVVDSEKDITKELNENDRVEDPSSVVVDPLDEELHIFAPRKSGFEVAPGIERLMYGQNAEKHLEKFEILLERHRTKNIGRHLEHLKYFDRSDSVKPHGQISKRIYTDVAEQRHFDAYARLLHLSKKEIENYKEAHRRFVLGKKYRFSRAPDESEMVRKAAVPVFDHDLPVKKQAITTELWKVGMKDVYKPPVGFAKTPGNVLNSEGRECFYSYDGEWKDGMMSGEGYYLFSDQMGYKGYFKNNNCEGPGRADYPIGSFYEGEWKAGKFHGNGRLECAGGTSYDGYWRWGRRSGKGNLTLPCGLTYEGEFLDGMPHGRGRMTSVLTGYIYDGSFIKSVFVFISPLSSQSHSRWII
jgi:hypothetical protein